MSSAGDDNEDALASLLGTRSKRQARLTIAGSLFHGMAQAKEQQIRAGGGRMPSERAEVIQYMKEVGVSALCAADILIDLDEEFPPGTLHP